MNNLKLYIISSTSFEEEGRNFNDFSIFEGGCSCGVDTAYSSINRFRNIPFKFDAINVATISYEALRPPRITTLSLRRIIRVSFAYIIGWIMDASDRI